MRFARLSGTDLQEADLGGSDLRHRHALLYKADLRGAVVIKATLETVFADTDLGEVTGLDTCLHAGPSMLDHRTFLKSAPLAGAFLRGCRLPGALIETLERLGTA